MGSEPLHFFPPRAEPDAEWTRVWNGRVVHEDSTLHADLVQRTLGLSAADWARMLDQYRPDDARMETIAGALRRVFESPHRASEIPSEVACPICGGPARHEIARGEAAYARCAACGHGFITHGAASPRIYADAAYFRGRDDGGAGYSDYAAEKDYREAKARRLLWWVGAPPGALLEVGSGFGYTRAAAEQLGWETAGADTNPHAAKAARELYGFETHTGQLPELLEAQIVAGRSWNLVLYQFVLEHLRDPVGELASAAEALAPGGSLVLVVPSFDALELEIFGASYRSLRNDHLHLFSRRSLEEALRAAGLVPRRATTTCSVHLLRGLTSDESLAALYDEGRGPDLYAVAGRA